MNPDQHGKLRKLFRNFVRQFLDNELTSADGNVLETVTNILALLAAASVCVSFLFVMKYCFALDRVAWEQRYAISWSDREFLISLSMAVTSFVTVLSWDSIFPSRRDCFILTSLPLRMRTMFAAKAASVLFLLGCVIVAANGFTSVVFPWVTLSERFTLPLYLKYAAAHAVAISAAALFTFLALLALQGVLISVLSYRVFERIAALVQLGTLLLILSLFFMMPDIAHPRVLARPENYRLAVWLPPLWFVGLYQWLLGGGTPVADSLARLAYTGLAVAAAVAGFVYGIGYRRHVRKVVEEEESALAPAGISPDVVGWIGRLCRDPVRAGVFRFVAQTMLRNRKHRVLLAVYCTAALGYVLEGIATMVRHGSTAWNRPSAEAVSVPLIFSFFLFVGMRVLFTIPVDLKANWIFRMTESNHPERYLAGVRTVMTVFGVLPVALLPLPLYGVLWGWGIALRHLGMVLLMQFILIEWLLRNFEKIPFTCSFMPGRANLKAMFAIYWTLFATLAFLITHLETWLLEEPAAYLVAAAGLACWLWRLVRGRQRRERELPGFTYEEQPAWAPATMNLV